MSNLSSIPPIGLMVIVVILSLFVLAVLLLFITYARYNRLASLVNGGLKRDNSFLRYVVNDYAEAYKRNGKDVKKDEDDLTPPTRENISLDDLKRTWMAKLTTQLSPIFISAKNKENIEELRSILYKKVRELHVQKYPYNDFLYPDEEL